MRTALLLFVIAFLLPTHAAAQGRTGYQLGLKPPKEIIERDEKAAREAYADLAAERLRKRLTAGGVKEFALAVVNPTTLRLETGMDLETGWLEALLASPGLVEIRVAAKDEPKWLELARTMPDVLEVRGQEKPYVWSANRAALRAWLKRIALQNQTVAVYPDEGGFRTVVLGDVVGTERDVRSVDVHSALGRRYATVSLSSAVGARLAGSAHSGVEQCAVVLDGELIGFVGAEDLKLRNRLQLSPPKGSVSDDRKSRDEWIFQVAGRLAAPMPVPIAVLKE